MVWVLPHPVAYQRISTCPIIKKATHPISKDSSIIPIKQPLEEGLTSSLIDVLLPRLMIKNFIKHEPLILIAFGPRGQEPPLHESPCTIFLVRVESEYTVVDDLDDVAEGSGGGNFCGGGEGAVAAESGVVAWFWETGCFW
jgi:hypothetical protein